MNEYKTKVAPGIIFLGAVILTSGAWFLFHNGTNLATNDTTSKTIANMTEKELDARIKKGIEDFIFEQQYGMATIDANNIEDDDAVLGDKNAPITIVEFSDFQCPYCELFFHETYPLLKEKYINTGKAKLVYRDFPLSNHPDAKPAAIAAECVRKISKSDEKYFEMHDQIFTAGPNQLSREQLISYATAVGVEQSALETCLDDDELDAEVEKDLADGISYGVTGTPSFIINGVMVNGAQPIEVFEEIIERQLAQ